MSYRKNPAWLDAQYDARGSVAEHPRIFERWAQASALVRGAAPAVLDLRYAEGEGATLDVFAATAAAAADGGAPVLMFIHGGWWRSLDKSDFSFLAASFAAAGAMLVVPNFALCPKASIEQQALQMTQAVRWVLANASAHGGDASRLAVIGHSAGAHLAAMLLSCRWKEVAPELPAQPLAGVLAISGVYDLEPLRHVSWLQPDLRLTPASLARLSPAFFPRPKAGKLYAVVGEEESDEFRRQTRLIRDVWGPTTVPVCETVPGMHHFNILESLADPAGRLHALALRLVGLR